MVRAELIKKHSYEIDDNALKYNPMGGLIVVLIITNDKDMNVSFNLIDNKDGTYYSTHYSMSSKIWKTIKNAGKGEE